ncbi:SEC-C motif-containing protein [Anaerobacterium chartisolvens]|uniref:SEC-C motif-containing protein n=1 Tax=Anaerobacterium chartisolvens TaxID=1297424 RepID=A0A369AIG1_9FIRM|nr:SEC-C metal-binding domain-containing protein [Anaerobacterium chartisolvens]RCX08895.1 SEC-C motif-containing protein [Anaerobacterium chartisolvens]
MSLYNEWKELAEDERSPKEQEAFWKEYFEREKNNYEAILESHEEIRSGKLGELAQTFNMDSVAFTGFLDGINSSLIEEIDLEELNEESDVKIEIDFEKLYFNMLEAKADWLYNLTQWDAVLSPQRRSEITAEFRRTKMAVSTKVGRNEPCPCGSGKKYKKCCG